MDLLPVILSIAQAEGPPSVLGQIIKAVMANEHVALARIWFLDQDCNCPECDWQGDETALHMRASDGRPLEPGADWSEIQRSHHRVALDSTAKLAQMVRSGEPVLIADIAADTVEPSIANGRNVSALKAWSDIRFVSAEPSSGSWPSSCACIPTRALWTG